MIARTRVTVVPPSDFAYADVLRVITAGLFVVAFFVMLWITWDAWRDWRAAKPENGVVYLAARYILRSLVSRTFVALLLAVIAITRVLAPGPAPALSFVQSAIMAVVAFILAGDAVLSWNARRQIDRFPVKGGDSQ